MVICSIALLLAMTGADPPPAQPADLQVEIEEALQRSALDGFAGAVTFTKEFWTVEGSGDQDAGDLRGIQTWKITTDGRGRLRVELDGKNPNYVHRSVIGETPEKMWMTCDASLLVFDKNATEDPAELDLRLHVAHLLLDQTRAELSELLGSPTGGAPIQVLSLDRDRAQPRAVLKADGKVQSISFKRVDGTLLVNSTASDDETGSYRWTFLDYYREGDRWLPRRVETRIHDKLGKSRRMVYTLLEYAPAPAQPEITSFLPPEPGDPGFEQIAVVEFFSDEGMIYEDFCFFSNSK